MSLDKLSVHVRLSPDMKHRLSVLAGLDARDEAAQAALMLEEAIVGKWHTVKVQMERATCLGLTGSDRNSPGSGGCK